MKSDEELVIELFRAKIIIFGKFKFKLHEKHPYALEFPMKLNLRKPPDGNLTDEIIMEIGKLFVELARRNNLKFDLVAGLPRAGDPLADAFIINGGADVTQRISLKKEDLASGKRRILPEIYGERKKGNIVLAIDDVITLGGSKEEAIEAFLLNDLYVTHCICFMDWGIGGKEILKEKYGINLLVAFTVEKLLSIAKDHGFMTSEERLEIIKTRDKIKEYIEQNESIILSA